MGSFISYHHLCGLSTRIILISRLESLFVPLFPFQGLQRQQLESPATTGALGVLRARLNALRRPSTVGAALSRAVPRTMERSDMQTG